MRLLVTGAKGFTGEHFIKAACSYGHEIIELQADLKHQEALIKEVRAAKPEAVVHLAAISFVGHAEASAFYDINVIGTQNLLDALTKLASAPKSILLASSANVYGNCEQSPIVESQSPAPVNHYAMSKLAMEYMAWTYLDRLPVFCVRPFNYIGPGQLESFVIPKLINHYVRRAEIIELGNLNVEREFNDVRFVCKAYLELLNKAQPGEVYNVCSGQPIALKKVLEILTPIAEHQLKVQMNPAFIRTNDIHRLCGNPEKLQKIIGIIPHTPIHDTLRWVYEQASAKYNLELSNHHESIQ